MVADRLAISISSGAPSPSHDVSDGRLVPGVRDALQTLSFGTGDRCGKPTVAHHPPKARLFPEAGSMSVYESAVGFAAPVLRRLAPKEGLDLSESVKRKSALNATRPPSRLRVLPKRRAAHAPTFRVLTKKSGICYTNQGYILLFVYVI